MKRVMHFIFQEGERYPMLLDGDGMPDYWVTLYVTENLRPQLKQTSIEGALRNIYHLKLWEEINGRDLILEMSQGGFLSDSDIASLRDHCLLSTQSLNEWLRLKRRKDVTKFSASYPKNVQHFQVVSRAHSANRLTHIAGFLHFTARTLLRQRANFIALTVLIDEMKNRILAQKPKVSGKSGLASDPDSKAPSPEVFERLMELVKENSPDNPYKNQSIRKRNELMFDVMYNTGMRAGEVLGLYISDIDYQAGKVSVVRRHDNQIDPRPKQPVAKTLERDIPIKISLAKRLRDYVMDFRSNIPNARLHPFLFVTHKRGAYQGRPLSESSFISRVLGPAVATVPELFGEISRHGFRHNFNYRLSKRIDAVNAKAKTDPSVKSISEKEEIQIRMSLNGWSSDDSAHVYNVRHINEMANKLMRDEMDDISKNIKKEGMK